MSTQPSEQQKAIRCQASGQSLAIGIVLGVAFGVALDNVAIGIGVGIALGIAIGSVLADRKVRNSEDRDF
jgi:hypothetical protein